MMKKVWLVLLAVVLVFGLAVLGCSSGSSGGGDPETEPFVPFEFTDFTEAIYNLGGSGGKTPVYDATTDSVVFTNTGDKNGSATILFKFAEIGYTLNRSDTLIFTYEIDIDTPKAVITAKDPSKWSSDFEGDSNWGVGQGREYVLGDDTLSEYTGPKVSGTWDGTTGTFEVLMKYLSKNATGIGFAQNFYAKFNNVEVGLNSKFSLKITKIENKKGEAPVDPVDPGEVDWPAIKDAEMVGEYEGDGSGKWAIDQKLPFTYFIIATVGGGNADGFGGVQIGVQGSGVTQEIRTTGNFTPLSHTATDIVYFVIDLSGYDNYSQVITESGWKQFYINDGKAVLGTYQGYFVDGSKTLVTKPAGAVDFVLEGTEDKAVIPGFATKTIPTFSVDTAYHAVTGITYTGPANTIADTEITLKATVAPWNATNKTIVWSCANANVTITGDKFKASAAGTYTVTATIANGATASTPFVKNDISIVVAAPSGVVAPDYSPDWDTLESAWASWASTHTHPTITPIVSGENKIGYTWDFTPVGASDADYDNVYAFFKVTFATGVSLADYDTVTFDWEGISGDLYSKQIGLYAKATKWANESLGATYLVSEKVDITTSGAGTETITIPIDKTKALPLEGNVLYISIFANLSKKGAVGGADTPTKYSIKNVVFSQDD